MDDLSRLEWILWGITKNTRKNSGEKHGENERNHETDIESITRVLDHRTQRDTRDPKSTTDDTSGSSSSPREGLESTRDLPVKGS